MAPIRIEGMHRVSVFLNRKRKLGIDATGRRKRTRATTTLPCFACVLGRRPPETATPMLASTAASLPPPLRRSPRGGCPPSSASRGSTGGSNPLHPRPRPRRRALACRADLQQDAPFVAAMGACVLASFAFPPPAARVRDAKDDDDKVDFGGTDTRMAVMGIIAFLPYFNWLSWIFAWLDSGRRLYLLYAAVYLAPYLRTNFSLSSDDGWLPIASIFICILHIQLEAGLRSGDIESFKFVERAWRFIFPDAAKEKDGYPGNKRGSFGVGRRSDRRIPSAHESREKLRNSDISKSWLDQPKDEKKNESDWD